MNRIDAEMLGRLVTLDRLVVVSTVREPTATEKSPVASRQTFGCGSSVDLGLGLAAEVGEGTPLLLHVIDPAFSVAPNSRPLERNC